MYVCMYVCIYIYIFMSLSLSLSLYIYIYIYIYIIQVPTFDYSNNMHSFGRADQSSKGNTPGLHSKIPAYNIFARGWVAQEPICS